MRREQRLVARAREHRLGHHGARQRGHAARVAAVDVEARVQQPEVAPVYERRGSRRARAGSAAARARPRAAARTPRRPRTGGSGARSGGSPSRGRGNRRCGRRPRRSRRRRAATARTRALGSIHGCIAVGSRRAPSGASSASIARHLAGEARGQPAERRRRSVRLELDHVQHQLVRPGEARRARSRSRSRRARPRSARSAIGRTSSVSASTIMYSSSMP